MNRNRKKNSICDPAAGKQGLGESGYGSHEGIPCVLRNNSSESLILEAISNLKMPSDANNEGGWLKGVWELLVHLLAPSCDSIITTK